MTNQEAFDKVYQHLLKQGEESLSEDGGMCMYRGVDGKSCAIGCLIPDPEYNPSFEGAPVTTIQRGVAALAGLSTGLLFDLQHVHDKVEVSGWDVELNVVARRYNLTIPEVLP